MVFIRILVLLNRRTCTNYFAIYGTIANEKRRLLRQSTSLEQPRGRGLLPWSVFYAESNVDARRIYPPCFPLELLLVDLIYCGAVCESCRERCIDCYVCLVQLWGTPQPWRFPPGRPVHKHNLTPTCRDSPLRETVYLKIATPGGITV